MALKPITRQEQIIAGKNLEPITRMERFLKEYGGGSGGGTQSDWNQTDSSAADFIKNKPFYYSPTGGDTLTWDGNTEGLVSVADFVYKVSDAVPTATDCAGGAVLRIYNGEGVIDASLSAEEIVQVTDEILTIGDVYIISSANAEIDGVAFPETGIYFFGSGGMYITSLTIPGYTGFPVTKKIEEKYLPGAVILYADDSLADGGYLYATEDTSDTSKRMTRTELIERMQSGSTLYVYLDLVTYKQYIACRTVNDNGEYGRATIAVNFNGTDTLLNLYTAEYTAS